MEFLGAAVGTGGARPPSMLRASILVVDDDENARHGLALALRGAGYRLTFASCGDEALELLRRDPVDIVISDHLMPGMSGLELLALVHDRYPDTVRIILTGHADTELAIKAINHGEIYRFLTKPCDRVELGVTLHLACEKLELERENRRLLAVIRTSPELTAHLEELRARSGPRG
jgi:two-component system, probable response regulator PhcQ